MNRNSSVNNKSRCAGRQRQRRPSARSCGSAAWRCRTRRIPVPAVMIAWTSVFFNTRSMQAFSTLMILPPRRDHLNMSRGHSLPSRPPNRPPPIQFRPPGSVDRQSASLPGRPAVWLRSCAAPARAPCGPRPRLRRRNRPVHPSFRLGRAASNQWLICSLQIRWTNDLTGVTELGLGLTLELQFQTPSADDPTGLRGCRHR
jgi:hypothetical protein